MKMAKYVFAKSYLIVVWFSLLQFYTTNIMFIQ